jgi:hypothetical protein
MLYVTGENDAAGMVSVLRTAARKFTARSDIIKKRMNTVMAHTSSPKYGWNICFMFIIP